MNFVNFSFLGSIWCHFKTLLKGTIVEKLTYLEVNLSHGLKFMAVVFCGATSNLDLELQHDEISLVEKIHIFCKILTKTLVRKCII